MALPNKQAMLDLMQQIRYAMYYANSIIDVMTNPTPYDDRSGPGNGYGCHRYGGSNKNFIQEGNRRHKYHDTGNANWAISGSISSAPEYKGLRDCLKAVYQQLRTACGKSGAYSGNPPSIEAYNYPDGYTFQPYTIAMYNSLFSSINTINASLNAHNSWYNSNNRCVLTCQVNCQTACQVRCQSVNWCHDQNCGAF